MSPMPSSGNTPPDAQNPDQRLLQAELAWLDVVLSRAVAAWQQAGQNPADSFRGLYLDDAQALVLLRRPPLASWNDLPLPAEAEQAYRQAERQAQEQRQALAARHQGRLARLQENFGLSSLECRLLLACLAPDLDPRYGQLYGYLNDDLTRRRPTPHLLLSLLLPPAERPAARALLQPAAPLFRHRLLHRIPGENTLDDTLAAFPGLADYLLGLPAPWPAPDAPPALLTLPWQDALQAASGHPLYLQSEDDLALEASARWLAHTRQIPLLETDLRLCRAGGTDSLEALAVSLRDARLWGALLHIRGWPPDGVDAPHRRAFLPRLWEHPAPLLISGPSPWPSGERPAQRPFRTLALPRPDYPRRRRLWEHFLGETPAPPQEISRLAAQFAFTTAQIRDAVNASRGQGLSLMAAARGQTEGALTGLAQKIPPRYTWEDIVLPPDQHTLLREIAATVRARPLVLETWGLGRKLASSPGITILFAGPPGTGKTMAAEVLASDLGLDLFKIDLSGVVSKYIGETEKNLSRIFAAAEASNAILFFDEADALFGKRSEVRDAHDRYANIEISYLLQRMEAYPGVTILATNLRANLDEAFTRRLHFAVDFPFPDETYRRRIWEALWPPALPTASDVDLSLLARRFKLAGGSIRNVLLNAAYLAAANGGLVTMEHLLHSTRRELQKMGRLVETEIWTTENERARPAP